ncbi:MAG: FecCD family ABC transporter permease [Anaerolineales bacterium]
MRHWPSVRAALVTALPLAFILVSYLALAWGAVTIPAPTIRGVILDDLADMLGVEYDSGLDYTNREVIRDAILIQQIRLPRVVLAGLVGAGLALAGAGLQGVFRNPLADPGLIGIANGAACGAVTAILLDVNFAADLGADRLSELPPFLRAAGLAAMSGGLLMLVLIGAVLRSREMVWASQVARWALIVVAGLVAALILIGLAGVLDVDQGDRVSEAIFAFVFALGVTLAVYRLAYRERRTEGATMLLVGLAINAIAAAYIGMVTFIVGPSETGDIVFWTLGSVAQAFWRDVHLMLPFVILSLIIFPALAGQLNLMALGAAEARHLGVGVAALRGAVLLVAALLTGISVALVGVVGFVGLLVPHLARGLYGPDHRALLPASALGGATFVIAADLFARTIAQPTDIPLGVVTTLVGGPFFLLLILANRRSIQ